MSKVRLRFAPSPTGPLHIGGVRTALYNFLYARQKGGKLILRIEDTDQARYMEGAEKYIVDSLTWCGITFDESPDTGGDYGPYRQSERKELYSKYALELISRGHAYYAFDTAEELDKMRADLAEKGIHSAKYNFETRGRMRNSLTMPANEVNELIDKGAPFTVRLLIPTDEVVTINDGVRGEVNFQTNELDDKIILKTDGMPTYHLANIVDDHFMEISHVIRGEEWLSSTAHHLLMYKFLDWEEPLYIHIPLILKPTGKGKLSKRDGAKFGFPVFPMSWESDYPEDSFEGFKEKGFLPDALLNFLAFLGWNPGTEQEIFHIDELIKAFSVEKIVKSGARFDYDKVKWFNQQYIIASDNDVLVDMILEEVKEKGFNEDRNFLRQFVAIMKERVETTTEFLSKGYYLFQRPHTYDEKTIRKRFKEDNIPAFENISQIIEEDDKNLQDKVKKYINDNGYSFGQIFPILRVAITGSMQGPDLFEMISLLGKDEAAGRIKLFLSKYSDADPS